MYLVDIESWKNHEKIPDNALEVPMTFDMDRFLETFDKRTAALDEKPFLTEKEKGLKEAYLAVLSSIKLELNAHKYL